MNRPIIPFGEAFQIVSDRGVRIPQSEYQPEGPIPVVDQGRDLVGGFTTRLDAVVDTELPLIVFGDHTRRLKFIDFPFAVGAQGVKLLRPRGQILPRYAFYMLRAVPLEDRGYGRHFALLRKVAIPVPSPDEQRRIVDILEDHLSRLSVGVGGLRQVETKLQALRSARLSSLVRRPGPVAKVGMVAEIISGPAFRSTLFGAPGDGIRLLRGDNIAPGSLRWDRMRTWPESLLEGYQHLLLEADDVILAMDRPLISTGLKLAILEPTDVPALLVQRVARLRARSNVLPSYLYLLLQTPQFAHHLRLDQVGTQIPHVTLEGIRSFEFPLPSLSEQAEVLDDVGRDLSLVRQVDATVQETTRRAAVLAQALLAAAFSGRLTNRASDLDRAEEMASA